MICEKCWRDAWLRRENEGGYSRSQTEYYREILLERQDNPCSPFAQEHGFEPEDVDE